MNNNAIAVMGYPDKLNKQRLNLHRNSAGGSKGQNKQKQK